MTDQEMSTEEILSSIRQMLSDEIQTEKTVESVQNISDTMDIFVLTPEMRCPEEDLLKEKMQRVLEKMSHQTQNTSHQNLPIDWKV